MRVEEKARSSDARTAQLTLVSILLGAILGALFMGLPANFASSVFLPSERAIDLRVVATLLAAIDLWIEYSWSVISTSMPFSMAHNLSYFLLTATLFGFGLSVDQNGAWLAWVAAASFAGAFASVVNGIFPVVGLLRNAETPSRARMLTTQLVQVGAQIALYLVMGALFSFGSLCANHSLPSTLEVEVAPTGWAALAVVCLVIDLAYFGIITMPSELELWNKVVETSEKPEPSVDGTASG